MDGGPGIQVGADDSWQRGVRPHCLWRIANVIREVGELIRYIRELPPADRRYPGYRTPLSNTTCPFECQVYYTSPPFKCLLPKIRAHLLCITWTWFLPAFLLFLLQVRERPTAGAARGNSIPTVLTRGFHFCFLFHHSTFSTTCHYIT